MQYHKEEHFIIPRFDQGATQRQMAARRHAYQHAE